MVIHFSKTSKMPCESWGIPTKFCKTGCKMKNAGLTTCAVCYADNGRIRFSESKINLEENLKIYLANPDKWLREMVEHFQIETPRFFRWFHSGDLQSPEMLDKIVKIAMECSETRFWLPTIEFDMVKRLETIPENLTIRVSSPKIDEIRQASIEGTQKSMVWWRCKPVQVQECKAYENDGKCLKCRACWDKKVEIIGYPLHRKVLLPKTLNLNGKEYRR